MQSPARVTERPDPQNADSDSVNKKQLDNVTESYTTQGEFTSLPAGNAEARDTHLADSNTEPRQARQPTFAR